MILLLGREVEENYYGIGQFVEMSNPEDEEFASSLLPGTLTKDNDFESLINSKSDLGEYIFETFSRRRERKEKKKGPLKELIGGIKVGKVSEIGI